MNTISTDDIFKPEIGSSKLKLLGINQNPPPDDDNIFLSFLDIAGTLVIAFPKDDKFLIGLQVGETYDVGAVLDELSKHQTDFNWEYEYTIE
jgi:hypothetical protein